MRFIGAAAVALVAASAAQAGCPSAEAVAAYVEARQAARPATALVAADAAPEDALCAQRMLVEAMIPSLGPVIGYKAGLTSPKAQEAFGVKEPIIGTLLEGMMLPDGATVKVAEGVRPLFEADLIVVIGDAGVNDAETPEAVLEHVASVRPFLELPDIAVGPDTKLTWSVLTAGGSGAWRGVLGDPIAVPRGAEGVAMLADFTARLTDATGAELSAAPGKVVLGHPLEAVIWIADMLARDGRALKAGDMVSAGSIGPLHPMKPGMRVTLTYDGLPGDPTLTAAFE